MEIPPWASDIHRATVKAMRQNALNSTDGKLMIQDPKGWRHMNPEWEQAFPHRIEYEIAQELRRESRSDHTGPTPTLDRWMAEGDNAKKPNPFAAEAVDPAGAPKRRMESAQGEYAGAEHRRAFEVPVEFRPKDQFATIRSHIQRTSSTAAENKVFNQTRQNPDTGFWTRDMGDLGTWLDEMTQEGRGAEAAMAKARVERIMGRRKGDTLTEGAKAFNRFASLTTMGLKLTLSPTQIIQQLSQIGAQLTVDPIATGAGVGRASGVAAKAIREGVGKALREGAKPHDIARAFWEGLREPIQEARRGGGMLPNAYTQAMDIADPRHGGPAMRTSRQAVDTAQLPQMTLDSISRAIAYQAAPTHLKHIQSNLRKGGKAAKRGHQDMIDLDLPADMRQAITRGEITPEIRNHVQQRYTAYLNVESGAIEFPRLIGDAGTDPRAMSARQLAGFQFGATRVFHEKVVKPLFRDRDPRALARAIVVATVVGELIERGNEVIPLIGKERKRDRLSYEEIAADLKRGDTESLWRRMGQNIGRSGLSGYGDVVWNIAAAEDSEKRRELEFDLQRKLPPLVMDAYHTLIHGASAAFDPSAEDKIRASAEDGKVDLHLNMKERDRLDVVMRELGRWLQSVAPQINRIKDQVGLRYSEEYRQQEIQKTLKNDLLPRKGRENRLRHIIDLGAK